MISSQRYFWTFLKLDINILQMNSKFTDWISLVEAGYNLEGDDSQCVNSGVKMYH